MSFEAVCDAYRLRSLPFTSQAEAETYLDAKRETGNVDFDRKARRYWCPGCPRCRIEETPREEADR